MDVVSVQLRSRREGGRELPLLLWRLPAPMRAIATAPHGGGLGVRRWVVNAQVPASYARRDPDHHLHRLAVSLGLPGRGVGLLTAADVRHHHHAHDHGVEVFATVGLGHPIQAAAPHSHAPVELVGTINVVAVLPERLSDAALVNTVATVTEAKVQALRDLGHRATGTATDAVVVLCPTEGRAADFGGPRSVWGSRLARAVYAAVAASPSAPSAPMGPTR
ncbi:MAG: adenosylcobinamide hydrolase [Acidimicrobiaceae bacterium]|nr:adenosylcobinamide hydrolase [Acidimicrobiaceae bacterium]